ncbi:MAG: hypothetical protein P1P64_02930 [Treponemataceae bacterium]
MEVAKFVFTAIGTFLSVFGLSFSIFQYWRKRQEEKFEKLEIKTKEFFIHEKEARQESMQRLEKRIENLEETLVRSLQQRMSGIEGELRGIKPVLQAIQNWFINNTGK